MKLYTVKEFAKENNICERTVLRRIENNLLPTYVNVKNLDGRGYVLWVNQCELCDIIEKACREYNKKVFGAKGNAELAAELSVKYKINTARFFRTVGL